jgi:hypothetical protein
MRALLTCAVLAAALGCAGAPVDSWGRECRGETDAKRRLELVRSIVDSGDERSIPVLIDCLGSVKAEKKGPPRVEGARAIVPNETAPPELWGLYVLTGQDHGMDIGKWSEWYESRRGKLQWDPGTRRFMPRT